MRETGKNPQNQNGTVDGQRKCIRRKNSPGFFVYDYGMADGQAAIFFCFLLSFGLKT